ncbi:MAG: hypothetical protein KBG28_22640 [Kofleriaceae bacterium]|jgi:hypothetical protein|nr:hypothetical protein [Kofleriaceae bacterium]MBP6838819.1 hypothetical protein [Kofleriaceae bacterium]MBP9206789.1 hypothetical protein [Kofleriaceae bacterium]
MVLPASARPPHPRGPIEVDAAAAPVDDAEPAEDQAAAPLAGREVDGELVVLRRRLDDHAVMARRTQQALTQLADSIGALVALGRKRERWLNLNSFVAYVLFTVLIGGGLFALYRTRAAELSAERAAVRDEQRQLEAVAGEQRERDAARQAAAGADAARAEEAAAAAAQADLLLRLYRLAATDPAALARELAGLGPSAIPTTDYALLTAAAGVPGPPRRVPNRAAVPARRRAPPHGAAPAMATVPTPAPADGAAP